MRASRAGTVREAERRNKRDEHRRNCVDISPDRRSLRRQERFGSEAEYGGACSSAAFNPSVIVTSACGRISDADNHSDMNTLAAQTACAGGSSYSINRTPNHCECNNENRGNQRGSSRSGNNVYYDDNVFDTSIGSQRTVQEMRWELRYFFMNPYLKYQKRGRKPWKLGVQLLKIIFVTVQLVLFGMSQFSLNNFYEGNREAFEHLFLKNWATSYDSKAYPKSNELYAIFEQEQFYKHLDYVAYQFANLKSHSIGTYGYDHDNGGEVRVLHVHQENYEEINITEKGQFFINQTINERYLDIPVNTSHNVSVKDYLKEHNQSINVDTMRILSINFIISSLHLKDTKTFTIPDCIRFNVTVTYDNIVHSGRLPISLNVQHDFFKNCSNKFDDDDLKTVSAKWMMVLDGGVIVLCVMSFIMCVRSFARAQHLGKKTVQFFKDHFDTDLSVTDKMEFVNLWYVIILVSDVCTIFGTVIKILIEISNSTNYDTCSLLLGTGCFLVWFGVLRYLGFFNKYNILIVTLKSAMPNVLRFLICAGIIYAAYAFFGWIVLGPYHPKFSTLAISVECMFSLINGDDMFATFREMSDRNTTIYAFSRIYLYTFISLFIYVVLSLIIAVIMDTYDTMKEYQRTGYVEGRLHSFMADARDEDIPGRGSFHTQSSIMQTLKWRRKFKKGLCCKRCDSLDSDDSLIT